MKTFIAILIFSLLLGCKKNPVDQKNFGHEQGNGTSGAIYTTSFEEYLSEFFFVDRSTSNYLSMEFAIAQSRTVELKNGDQLEIEVLHQ